MRPWTWTSPSVSSVIRERILSRVLLPAPFRPTTPTTWPRFMSKEICLSAQNASFVDEPRKPRFAQESRVSASVLSCSPRWRSVYCLPTPFIEMAVSLDDIREFLLCPAEYDGSNNQHDHPNGCGIANRPPLWLAGAKDGPADGVHEAGNRVEIVVRLKPRRDGSSRVRNGTGEEQHLDHHRDDMVDVTVLDGQCARPQTDADGEHEKDRQP